MLSEFHKEIPGHQYFITDDCEGSRVRAEFHTGA
jgi:hypothetical protein